MDAPTDEEQQQPGRQENDFEERARDNAQEKVDKTTKLLSQVQDENENSKSSESKVPPQDTASGDFTAEEIKSSGESSKDELIKAVEQIEKTQEAVKEKDSSNKSDSENRPDVITIDHSSVLRFRNSFFEVVEELRIARVMESENEEKIKSLMTEKHEMERKQEEAIEKYNNAVNEQSKMEEQIRKQYQDRISHFEEEKAKQQLFIECREKEMKTLKDEVRSLNLLKYSLEKKMKDQERRIQLQDSGRESIEVQISELERRYKELAGQSSRLSELTDKVETNVSEASRLHRKLMYTNEHQQCLLDTYKRELESSRQKLVSLKATVARQNDSLNLAKQEKLLEVNELRKQLHQQTEITKQVEEHLSRVRSENKELLGSLNDSHGVIEKHVESIDKHTEMEAIAHLQLDELKTDYENLKKMHNDEVEKREELERITRTQETKLQEEQEAFSERLKDLQTELSNLSQAHNALEEQNSRSSAQNAEQAEQIAGLEEEIEKLRISLQESKNEIESKSEELESLKKSHNKESALANKELLCVKNECQQLQSTLTESRATSKQREDLVSELKGKLEEKEGKIAELLTLKEEQDKESAVVNEKLEQSKKEFHDAMQNLEANKSKENKAIVQLKGELEMKVAELTKLRNHVTYDVAVQTDRNTAEIIHSEEKSTFHCKDSEQCPRVETGVAKEHESSSVLSVDPSEVASVTLFSNAHLVDKEECESQISPQISSDEDVVEKRPVVDRKQTSSNVVTQNSATKTLNVVGSAAHGGKKTVIDCDVDAQTSHCTSTSDSQPQKIKSILKGTRFVPPEKKDYTEQRQNDRDAQNNSSNETEEEKGAHKRQNINIENNLERIFPGKENNSHSWKKKEQSFLEKATVLPGNENHSPSPPPPVMEQTKKVRFSLNSDNSQVSSPSGFSSITDQAVPTEDEGVAQGNPTEVELQGLFSDEEDNLSMEQGISSQISRIENLLKSDRLRTNRKRKFPVL